MRAFRRTACFVVGLMLTSHPLLAEVTLPSMFSDNMVLQREAKISVWGKASPGEAVSVTLGGQHKSTKADDHGAWKVALDALEAGGPFEIKVEGGNAITIHNVLVGEVWVCSGQSNMAWTVNQSSDAKREIAAADHPKIRLFTVPNTTSSRPRDAVVGKWDECSPKSVPDFSAVAYFFGRELHEKLDVPIGLIETAWGGTPAESWTTRETMESDPELKVIVERSDKSVSAHGDALRKYVQDFTSWIEAAEKADAAGEPLPPPPAVPGDPRVNPHRPSVLYNAMVAPLVPYAIRGAIWYQGESNAGRAYQYRTLFPSMIRDWRRVWGQGDFPFLFVQLANFEAHRPGDPGAPRDPNAEPGESAWAELREAQLMTLALPNTGMAVIIDIGDRYDIHPKNKQDVGRRLALAALAGTYGKELVHSGPMYDSVKFEDGRAQLTFKHVGGGLVAKGGSELKGFAIAGEDRKFVWAEAKIEGDKVVVSSDKVKRPVAVRYAWANDPACNLFNQAGLPASSFRTDDWPGVTADQK